MYVGRFPTVRMEIFLWAISISFSALAFIGILQRFVVVTKALEAGCRLPLSPKV